MGRTYDPFHVTISVKEPDTCLVKAKSKIGEAETQTRLPFAENELKEKLHRFALMAEGNATPKEAELKEFGQEQHKMLFHDAVWELFKKATRAAEHADGLVIELDIQSPKLSQIPWELLHDGTDFLALSRRTPIVRSIHPSKGETAGEVKPIELPVRILFAAAKPRGEAPLNLGSQVRHVCRALRPAIQEGTVILHPALGDEVQPNSFLEALRVGGYHVLHISTHGAFLEQLERGFVLLQDGVGEAAPLAINTLAGMIRDTSIQLIYLDACETAAGSSLSENLLRSGASAALAMRFPIREGLASRFSEVFYQYLMKGDPIWGAITEARIVLLDLLGRETIDWAIPVLHVRSGYEFTTVGSPQPKTRFGHSNPPTRFVGREQQLDDLTEKLLTQSRLVLVHGFGGIGKSTLIQKTLSEIELLFEDTCLIDCRGVKSITDVMPRIYQMLAVNGYPVIEEKLRDLTESGKIRLLCEQLDKGRFLIVLDNIDDMLDNPTTELMTHVGQFNKAKLLATCRIHSDLVDGQREVHLGSLETRYAIALIREIGRDIPRIRDASDLDLRRINEKLGGHPYSIVIAVPMFSGLPFEEVLNDLPTRVGSADEQSKRVLSWSYSKLSPEEQRFLENISVFAGHVPLQALLIINGGKGEDIVRALVTKKNMVEFEDQAELYSLQPMLREHAYVRLGDRKDEIQIKAANEIAPRLLGALWSEALRLYEVGVDSARRTGDKNLLPLLHALGDSYHRVGEYEKAEACQQETLNRARKLGDLSGAAAALHSRGMIEQYKGNYDKAKELYNQSLDISQEVGDQQNIARTLHQLATIEKDRGNYDDAEKLYKLVLDTSRKSGDLFTVSTTLHQLAMIEQARGKNGDAETLYNQSLEIAQKLGNQSSVSTTLHQLASIELARGNYDSAKRLYKESLDIDRELGNRWGIARTLHQLAMTEQARGNYDEAKNLYDQSLEIKRKLGDQSGMATTLHNLATIEQARNNYDEAEKLYNQALEIERKLGNQAGIAATLQSLAALELARGNYVEASKLFNRNLEVQRRLGDQPRVAAALHNLGMIEQSRRNYDEAKKLYDQSLEISRKLENKLLIAQTLSQLGSLAEEQTDLELAERLCQEAWQISEQLGAKQLVEIAEKNLERVQQARQNARSQARPSK